MKQLNSSVLVSAPCKVHLLGEHSVVYGKPAILASVGKRLSVKLKLIDKDVICIKSDKIPYTEKSFDEVNKLFKDRLFKWQSFSRSNHINLLKSITRGAVTYPLLCIAKTMKNINFPDSLGLSFDISSDIPVGAGLGSSSALAVGIVSSILYLHEGILNKKRINDTAFECEKFRHGNPSGGDNSTVVYGGLVWYQKKSDTDKIINPIDIKISENIKNSFLFIDTGKPKESTGEMVSLVRQIYQADKTGVSKIFDDQESLVYQLLEAVKRDNIVKIIDIIKEGQLNLERLSVCSEEVSGMIREIENSGGAAKICGGGGKTAGTGIVLAIHKDPDILKSVADKFDYPYFQAELGVEGVMISK